MKQHNETLTGLRGFLALSVVLYHIYESAVLENYITALPKNNILYLIHHAGSTSVNLFFVISGYLITRSLISTRTVKAFFINRLLRIYPVFIVIHLMIFAVGPFLKYKWMDGIGAGEYMLHFFSNLLLLPGMFPLPIAQIVAWSLSYEFAFYILAGLVFIVWSKESYHRFVKYFCFFLLAAVCLTVVYWHPNFLFFLVGIAVFMSENKIKASWKPSKLFSLGGFILLIFIFLSYQLKQFYLIIPLLLSYLFFLTVAMEHGFFSRFLRTRTMRYLGQISFSLYMWHTVIMFPLKRIVPRIGAGVPEYEFAIYAVLSLALSIAVSHVSYWYIEIKLTDFIKKSFRTRRYKANKKAGTSYLF